MASLQPSSSADDGGRSTRSGASPVLLVEDNPGDVRLMREMLRGPGFGFELRPVERLAAAVEELQYRSYAAVLLDLGLPDSQGLSTLTRLLERAPRAPVIVTTGFDDEETAVQAVRLGAQDYIVKGRFDARLLSRTLRYAIERARAEQAVRESAEQFRRLFDEGPNPMWVLGRVGFPILDANRAAVEEYGWSDEEFRTMTAEQLVPPAAREALREHLVRARDASAGVRLAENQPWIQLTRMGGQREVLLSLCPMPYQRQPALLLVASDVSELRRLQAQLAQAAKMEAVGHLASGVAHDFNNTLSLISGYAEMLSLEDGASPAAVRRATQILGAVDQSAGLTRQLLAFGRRQALEPTPLDLNALLDELGEVLRRLIGKGIRIELRPAERLGRVEADPVQIQQVVMNLAINARDAMPRGGTLTVETSEVEVDAEVAARHPDARPGRHVRLRFSDTGAGMSAETLEHLFEPFYTTKSADGGTGLGLATVYGIIRQSGGFVEVASAPGAGTTFGIHLPLVVDARAAGPALDRG